uniref:CARMIL_C domain-containing protein n=1 Tax=Macrostomum lignano TaxID=282301 RepID=A0A1I8FN99_9PLAT
KKRIRRSSHSSSSGQRQSSSPRSTTTPADVSRSCWPLWPMAPTRANDSAPRPLLPAEPPALLTKHRVRPLKPPAAAPAETPAWQLIRPRPRRRPTVPLSDLPRRSGSDNDSDDGERGRGPRMMQRRLRQFEPSITPAQTSQSPDIFAESPLNQTPIVESADLRSRRRERGSASPRLPRRFPASPTACPAASSASPPPPQPSSRC